MRVLLLTRYTRLGASSRLRFLQYLPFLKTRGIEVTVSPLLDDAYLQRRYDGRPRVWGRIAGAYLERSKVLSTVADYDLLWIEKELFPSLPATWERRLATKGVRFVVDYDDAIFHNYDMNSSALVRRLLGNKIDRVMTNATLVVAGSNYLAARARAAGAARVAILPTVVDLERYGRPVDVQNDTFTIGWIGSPETARYLRLVEGALAEVCKQRKAKVVVVGLKENPLSSVPVEVLPWSEQREVDALRQVDAGIMPLPDEPWERGKCAYKMIQYMACGRPVVASPVGANTSVITHGSEGFLANTQDEWASALYRLSDDSVLRVSMGRAARRKVEAAYSLQITAARLETLLREAACT